ncbi:enamine deaminase RidA [Paenarthrobacter nitroguajacolicus]|uniref:RidA family protein n=1 Tax=Paenarthrobacter nitroguajacolicus TaxID=211146 RepID=UPI0015BD09F1|nr:RidA family protein [Paenarthrobacter nitroguajacolicus]NWL10054.1 enamine deaminase RidA [Paenarthrobacter nitroguajacolicus]
MNTTYSPTLDVDGITGPDSPYPSATVCGDIIYVSGQVSFADDGSVAGIGDVAVQTQCSLERLARILSVFGATLDNVVSCTVYLTDAAHAGVFNQAWVTAFGGHRPSRATVVSGLLDPRLLVEVQAIARVPQGHIPQGGIAPGLQEPK